MHILNGVNQKGVEWTEDEDDGDSVCTYECDKSTEMLCLSDNKRTIFN